MPRLLIAVLLATVLGAAGAQTPWPAYMDTLQRDVSDSPVEAVLPVDVTVSTPPPDLPAARARWSGRWQGWACPSRSCDLRLAVERVDAHGAAVAYAGTSALATNVFRAEGRFVDDELHVVAPSGNRLAFRLRADGDMEMSLWRPDGQLLSAGVLTQRTLVAPYVRAVERLPTPWVEEGQPVALAVIRYRPRDGAGPWPTLVMHHGSTGNGDRPELFAVPWTAVEVARHFAAQGWQVLFPQRRGRGGSNGLYDEGFPPNRAAYACDPRHSLPGADRALEDVHHVMRHVASRPDVDAARLLIGGVSRGGILASAYAGQHPNGLQGVINFVGGWVGDRCSHADHVNQSLFRRAAAYPLPILWLYGDRDPFYALRHSRGNFEAFRAVGGQGRFVEYAFPAGQNGHALASRPERWRGDVDSYLREALPR